MLKYSNDIMLQIISTCTI